MKLNNPIKLLVKLIEVGLAKQVPATGLGVFRIAFALVILQEVAFLLYFRHLIFDPLPFIECASALVPISLCLWGIAAFCLCVGLYSRCAALANYLFWVGFVLLTPMRQDFDGGFDQLMTGSSFLLIFLPAERALSIDKLRLKLRFSGADRRYRPPERVSVLCYYVPLALSLGLLYLDAGIHKLSAEFWRNGMGAWLPSTMPYYISAVDMSWLLNHETLQRTIGYSIIVFQFLFVFLCWFRRFRVALMLTGVALHAGITVSLNIYPFGIGMLVHYFLMVPFAWWRFLAAALRLRQPPLTVFYDEQCPLCRRTVVTVEHFDVLRAVAFKGLQSSARGHRELDGLSDAELLKDLYASDRRGRLYGGLDTYIRILLQMRYTALFGCLLSIPGIHQLARRVYRRIADTRARQVCDASCAVPDSTPAAAADALAMFLERSARTRGQQSRAVLAFLALILLLQVNSTVRFGILHRLEMEAGESPAGRVAALISDPLMLFSHVFFGISPHALYMDDHFNGYERILAFTYRDESGRERWLPFVNPEGRLVAPNWGRVQSMWANIAVTPRPDPERLAKFTRKVTAFWGTKLGLDLSDTVFTVKMKTVRAPAQWEKDLRANNLARPWRDAGRVVWHAGAMRMELPAIARSGSLPIERPSTAAASAPSR